MSRETVTPQIPQVTESSLVEVVRAIKEVVEVREGRRGDVLDEAVTYRDLVALGLVRQLNTGGYGANNGTTDLPVAAPEPDAVTPVVEIPYSPVANVLDGLDRLIAASPLVRDLRSRIEAMENGLWVPEYISDVLVQSRSLARESRTLVSEVQGNQAAVQQVMEAADGLRAKYVVKVDVNGKVAGFGLAAYPNLEGTTTTDFAIAADKMFIVPSTDYSQESTPASDSTELKLWYKPSLDKYYRYSVSGAAWTEVTIQSPFIVLTKATTVDGKTVQPGVYMRNGFIQNLTADKITAGTINVAVSLTAAKLLGGQYTTWAWPTTAGGGYYLGSEGLALGTKDVSVAATTITAGKRYRVLTVGTTDFTTVGGVNTVGATFKATGTPTGSGTVALESFFLAQANGDVYASGFQFVDGVLTIEQIDVIGTNQIVAGAVSARAGAALTSNTVLTTTATSVLSVSLAAAGNPIWVHVNLYCRGATGTAALDLYVGGTKVRGDTAGGGFWDDLIAPYSNIVYSHYIASPGSGTITVEIKAASSLGGDAYLLGGTSTTPASNLFAMATKR